MFKLISAVGKILLSWKGCFGQSEVEVLKFSPTSLGIYFWTLSYAVFLTNFFFLPQYWQNLLESNFHPLTARIYLVTKRRRPSLDRYGSTTMLFTWWYISLDFMKHRNHVWLQLDSNHLAKLASLAKWSSVRLRTKWFWIRVQLQSLHLQISCLLRARSSLTFRQL